MKRWGFSLGANPGGVLGWDKSVRSWLKKKETFSLTAEAHWQTLPQDSDAFASDFGYPNITLGLRYAWNNRVRMHRVEEQLWNREGEVDYMSHLGNTLSAYAEFERPLLRTRHWEIAYALGVGLGFNTLYYNEKDDIDNYLIGSRWLIHFVAAGYATYYFQPQWGVRAGVEFYHHSNGALDRPNKGSNIFGPSIGIIYSPAHAAGSNWERLREPFSPYAYMLVTAGFCGKSLLEDWNHRDILPEADHFNVYGMGSLQVDFMYRYARRWASGVGFDVFYTPYLDHIKKLDLIDGWTDEKYYKWSYALALKHEVFWKNWSMHVALGFYLRRHMGWHADTVVEKGYYERVGLRYHFPSLGGLAVGAAVKAHLGKADFTEVTLSYPIRLTKRSAH